MQIITFIKELILFFIPRYVTDRVALNHTGGVWSVVCLEHQVEPDDLMFIDAYGTIKTFTWFGIAKGGIVYRD